MKTLHLLRHAKSAWDDPELADHDRSLAPRGIRAAKAVGRHLDGQRFRPDRILCSTARRARYTLDLVLSKLDGGRAIPVEYESGLYLAGDQALLARVRGLPDDVGSVLLVGHNPDLHDLGMALIGRGDPEKVEALCRKYPTAAFATLEFPVEAWSDIAPRTGILAEFIVPKNLT